MWMKIGNERCDEEQDGPVGVCVCVCVYKNQPHLNASPRTQTSLREKKNRNKQEI